MFKGDSMYSILPIDATYFFNITKTEKSSNFVLANIQGYGIESHHPLDDIVN